MLSQLDRGAVLGLWGPFTSPPRSGSWVRRPCCRALDPTGVGSLVCRRHASAQRAIPARRSVRVRWGQRWDLAKR
jgi:hypothetical protein